MENRLIPIAPELKDKYLANPTACPFCGSEALSARAHGFLPASCCRQCMACKRIFREWFQIVDITEEKEAINNTIAVDFSVKP